MDTHSSAAAEALGRLRTEMNKENTEIINKTKIQHKIKEDIDLKRRDLEKAQQQVQTAERDLATLEQHAKEIDIDINVLKQQRTQNQQKIAQMDQELQKLIKESKENHN